MACESSCVDRAKLFAVACRTSDGFLDGKTRQLPSDAQRARLATMASIVQFKKGQQVYSRGEV
jgi:hypothetical protein